MADGSKKSAMVRPRRPSPPRAPRRNKRRRLARLRRPNKIEESQGSNDIPEIILPIKKEPEAKSNEVKDSECKKASAAVRLCELTKEQKELKGLIRKLKKMIESIVKDREREQACLRAMMTEEDRVKRVIEGRMQEERRGMLESGGRRPCSNGGNNELVIEGSDDCKPKGGDASQIDVATTDAYVEDSSVASIELEKRGDLKFDCHEERLGQTPMERVEDSSSNVNDQQEEPGFSIEDIMNGNPVSVSSGPKDWPMEVVESNGVPDKSVKEYENAEDIGPINCPCLVSPPCNNHVSDSVCSPNQVPKEFTRSFAEGKERNSSADPPPEHQPISELLSKASALATVNRKNEWRLSAVTREPMAPSRLKTRFKLDYPTKASTMSRSANDNCNEVGKELNKFGDDGVSSWRAQPRSALFRVPEDILMGLVLSSFLEPRDFCVVVSTCKRLWDSAKSRGQKDWRKLFESRQAGATPKRLPSSGETDMGLKKPTKASLKRESPAIILEPGVIGGDFRSHILSKEATAQSVRRHLAGDGQKANPVLSFTPMQNVERNPILVKSKLQEVLMSPEKLADVKALGIEIRKMYDEKDRFTSGRAGSVNVRLRKCEVQERAVLLHVDVAQQLHEATESLKAVEGIGLCRKKGCPNDENGCRCCSSHCENCLKCCKETMRKKANGKEANFRCSMGLITVSRGREAEQVTVRKLNLLWWYSAGELKQQALIQMGVVRDLEERQKPAAVSFSRNRKPGAAVTVEVGERPVWNWNAD
mmetsp:Transcript_5361/g.9622  ORF Transcript_5361/g.9622 Transcript_5361/m.9622 type:complete len:762 (-) Transcript_5361:350-2635(-)